MFNAQAVNSRNDKMNNQQHKKRPQLNKKPSGNNNNSNNSKKVSVFQTIENIDLFPKPKIYTSTTYPIPTPFTEPKEANFDIPTIKQRSAAQLTTNAKLLASNFLNTSRQLGKSLCDDENGQQLSKEFKDPLVSIILQKRATSKTLKLGSNTVDIFTKDKKIIPDNPVIKSASKLLNRLVEKESLQTPAKRIRDEVIDASSSMKKNRRTLELSGTADTTMELSFEGKAMDKSDLVKLVDSSAIIADESQHPDVSIIDTQNLLQNQSFQF